jgi:hypothetical protein
MQDFYPTILKFAIVAALALLFIGVTFVPQQEATQVMGDNMDQALNSVKEIIDESNKITGAQVKIIIHDKCEPGNTIAYIVVIGSDAYTFIDDPNSSENIDGYGGHDIDVLVNDDDEYVKTTTATGITYTRI